ATGLPTIQPPWNSTPLKIIHHLAVLPLGIILFAACSGGPSSTPVEDHGPQGAGLTPEQQARVDADRMRVGDFYSNRIEFFYLDNPKQPKGGTVFLGDSITQGLPVEKAWPHGPAINRGIGGDRTATVIDRIDVSVTALEPSRVYVLSACNDLVPDTYTPTDDLRSQFITLIDDIQTAVPGVEIIMQSTFPAGARFEDANERIRQHNAWLRDYCEEYGIAFIDLHPILTDEVGGFRQDYSADGIHATIRGKIAWLEQLADPDAFPEILRTLKDDWRAAHGSSRTLAAIDPPTGGEHPGGRGPEELVVYTPDSGRATTGTNVWGLEAVVVDGRVTMVRNGDAPIPHDGYVISGHGSSGDWVAINMRPGTVVEYDEKTVRWTEIPPPGQTTRGRLEALWDAAIVAFLDGARPDAEELLVAVSRVRQIDHQPTDVELSALEAELGFE
ncbi:MAG: hypothetical protein JJU11_10880, partial [Candidatus Sumerlaeia bacterium]|nr:hypothetical protein [Candidatus Sumerlaeia bacterium]